MSPFNCAPGLDAVRAASEEVRLFLDGYWASLDTDSTDKCIPTSILLTRILRKRFGGNWRVMCGFWNPDKGRHAQEHCWVVERGWDIHVDLTGDQFAKDKVIVCRKADCPYEQSGAFLMVLSRFWKKELVPLERAYQEHSSLVAA